MYNGKEQQTALGLGWYDYGARMYDPSIGRFFTHDRFSEKYLGLAPYHYTANNPILFVDVNGDSLKLTNGGNQDLIGRALAIANKGAGGFVIYSADTDGNISSQRTDQFGPISPKEQAFIDQMECSISCATKVEIGLVDASENVTGGSYNLEQMDISDIEAFKEGPIMSAASVFIHEIAEQTEKQVNNLPQITSTDNSGYTQAHTRAVIVENDVNGAERMHNGAAVQDNTTGSSFGGKSSVGPRSGTVIFEHKLNDGSVKRVTWTLNRNNTLMLIKRRIKCIVFSILLLFISCKSKTEGECRNGEAISTVENRLILAEKRVTDTVIVSLDFNPVNFFGELSGHYTSVGDGTIAGILDFSYSDVEEWRKWFHQNKDSLCINEKGEVILIK